MSWGRWSPPADFMRGTIKKVPATLQQKLSVFVAAPRESCDETSGRFRRPCATLGAGLVAARPVPPNPRLVDGVALRLCLPASAGTWGVANLWAREDFRRPCAALGAGLVAARPVPPNTRLVDGVALRLGLPAPADTWGVANRRAREEFRRPCAALGAGLVAARPVPPTYEPA